MSEALKMQLALYAIVDAAANYGKYGTQSTSEHLLNCQAKFLEAFSPKPVIVTAGYSVDREHRQAFYRACPSGSCHLYAHDMRTDVDVIYVHATAEQQAIIAETLKC